MDNVKISSQENVHPGRKISEKNFGKNIYSDPRVFSLYELMIISSLPKSWDIPEKISESFLRRLIGEGIPPLFVKKVFKATIAAVVPAPATGITSSCPLIFFIQLILGALVFDFVNATATLANSLKMINVTSLSLIHI